MTFSTSPALVGRLVAELAERRKERGWSQIEVDHRLGWADGLTGKYEAGIRLPTLAALTWWADALGLRLGFEGAERQPTDREALKGLALARLAAGATVREVAADIEVAPSTVSFWWQSVQRLDSRKPQKQRARGASLSSKSEPST